MLASKPLSKLHPKEGHDDCYLLGFVSVLIVLFDHVE